MVAAKDSVLGMKNKDIMLFGYDYEDPEFQGDTLIRKIFAKKYPH